MKIKNLNNMIIVLFVVIYIVSPVDLVPDVVPGLGQLDEILIGLICYFLLDKSED